jgi:ppGpp synthetase/RelA/SpoT-type nucleotidyltranferase
MAWTKIKYSKKDVDRAGNILTNKNSSVIDIDQALNVLDNWRSSHSFPLHIFKKRLKIVSVKIDPSALVVQRLKRTPSIIKKLKREQTKHMNLAQMQDIGGCRSVVSSVKLVRKLCDEYYHIDKNTKGKHCDLKHVFKNKKDYIATPKPDGYRSIHLIYKYNSDKKQKKYNGLLLEVQVRSKLQHFWATAVETVDHFTKQAIKSNEGEKDWMDFFKLISSVFANMEGTPIVFGTPEDKFELFTQVKNLSDKLGVLNKIRSWANLLKTIDFIEQKHLHKPHFYLLDLNIDTKELTISAFDKTDEEKASFAYSEAEKKATQDKLNKDIVLVEADTTKELKKAYPNYFLDTNEFLSILQSYLNSKFK